MKGDEVGARGTGSCRLVQAGRKAPAAQPWKRHDDSAIFPCRIKDVTRDFSDDRPGRWHRLPAHHQHITVPSISQGLMNERNTNEANPS